MKHICICGDCFEQLARLKNASVDMILTDIPYGGECSGFKEGGLQKINRVGADVDSMADFDTEKFIRECIRVCRGTFIVFCGYKQMGIIREVFDSMRPKLQMFRMINWEKTNVSPMNGQYFFLNSNEFAACFRKPKSWWGGHCQHTNFIHKTTPLPWHSTSKPVGLMQQLIELGCPPGGTVLDPCAGSFSVAIAAEKAGRNSVGFELNPDFFVKAIERLELEGACPTVLPAQTGWLKP